MRIDIHKSWLKTFAFRSGLHIQALRSIPDKRKVYPKEEDIFRAFTIDRNKVKVVIIGQDPYYKKGIADGLAFSTRRKTTPPSLQGIFKEIKRDIGELSIEGNDLTPWMKQGVLLMNTALTVRDKEPNSHLDIWRNFIDSVIFHLSGPIFLLWGERAKQKKKLITRSPILESSHPSPLSSYRGFDGCGHFSKVNELLIASGKEPILW